MVEFSCVLQQKIYADERLAFEEVVDTVIDIVRITIVVLHIRTTFSRIQAQFLGTIEFRLRKAVLTGPFCHTYSSNDAPQDVVALAANTHGEGIFCATEEEHR